MLLQGKEVVSLSGIRPSSLMHAQLVDARRLGRSLAALALPAHPFTITAVLSLLRLDRHPALTSDIQGASMIVGHDEGLCPAIPLS